MATVCKTSVASLLTERLTERLKAYRNYVARAARGEWLDADVAADARKALRHLGLPLFAWRRDLAACREAMHATGNRRIELLLNHPHLFDDADTWVESRTRAIAHQRGGDLCYP